MKHEQFKLKNSKSDDIFFQVWNDVEDAIANICLVHGFAEHSDRYTQLSKYFNDHRINIYAYDRYGHGRSDGKRGHAVSLDLLMEEIEMLVQLSKKRSPNLPTFIYGHSQGGNLTLNYILRNKPEITGAIVTGSWIYLGNSPPKIQEMLLLFLAKFLPTLSVKTKLNPEFISKDPIEVKKYVDDPMVFDSITLGNAVVMVDAADFLKGKHSSKTPLLVMHGNDDKICLPKGSDEFVSNFEGKAKLIKWPGRYHEIHNEYKREDVYLETLNWIKEQVS